MFRTCDICKCKKFRIKRVMINYVKRYSKNGYDIEENGQEAKYMCPVCRKLHKKRQLTNKNYSDNIVFYKNSIMLRNKNHLVMIKLSNTEWFFVFGLNDIEHLLLFDGSNKAPVFLLFSYCVME